MIHPAPRPPRQPKAPRQHNSTLPRAVAPKLAPPKTLKKKKLVRRRTSLPKVNPTRRTREWKRAYGSRARVAWVKQQPCVACGVSGKSENAHIVTGGMGRKADYTKIVPLCGRWPDGYPGCHRILDHGGRAALYKLSASIDAMFRGAPALTNLDAKAAETEKAWAAHIAGRTD